MVSVCLCRLQTQMGTESVKSSLGMGKNTNLEVVVIVISFVQNLGERSGKKFLAYKLAYRIM